MVSCHDLLDQEPISRAIGDTFWETEADVEKGIAGNYALLRDALANGVLFQYGDLTADLFRKGWNAGNDAFYLPGFSGLDEVLQSDQLFKCRYQSNCKYAAFGIWK